MWQSEATVGPVMESASPTALLQKSTRKQTSGETASSTVVATNTAALALAAPDSIVSAPLAVPHLAAAPTSNHTSDLVPSVPRYPAAVKRKRMAAGQLPGVELVTVSGFGGQGGNVKILKGSAGDDADGIGNQSIPCEYVVTLQGGIKATIPAVPAPSTKSVDEFLDDILNARGYDASRFPALQTKYRTVPSEKQVVDYDMRFVTAIRNSNLGQITKLQTEGRHMNACNKVHFP